MSLWPYALVLNGATLPLADVLADLTLHRGRDSVDSDPTADTLQITIQEVDHAFAAGFDVGQTLTLTVRDGAGPILPRFTGRVTDARLDDDELTIIATGFVSTLRSYVVGAVDWPAESWSARVSRIFTEAGLASKLDLRRDPSFDPTLAPRTTATAGTTTLGDYLAFLASSLGALVADKPDGTVLVQALGARRLEDEVALDPADVAFVPVWEKQLPGGNIVTVRYQADQGASVTARDDVSVARYGPQPVTVDTSFQNAADASTRAAQRLSRGAYSRWAMSDAPIVRGLNLTLGAPVVLSELPEAAPHDPWTPVLEGWTDTISGDVWTMELALSDPLVSGVTLPWDAVPRTAAYQWSTVDRATAWKDALTLDDLEAA